jgi:DNA invertase Pin-like site-specific DNA recombinase
MIADAKELGDFEAILCWDQARFGRFDSIEAGYYINPLRKAGVYLATVMDGVIDWNDSTARIISNVRQEGKHQQLVDHSANVTRGQLTSAQKGSWLGSPPYGYRIEGPKYAKRLVLDDPGKVRIVKRIFHEFVEGRRSMMGIAKLKLANARANLVLLDPPNIHAAQSTSSRRRGRSLSRS